MVKKSSTKSTIKSPLHASGPIRPTHGKPSVPAYERAVHGANPRVHTTERKMATKPSKRAK
jgi:hypothetical protein